MEKAAQDEAARKKKRGLKMAANVRRTSSIVAEQQASAMAAAARAVPEGTVAPEPRIVSNAQSPFNAMGPPPPRAPGVAGVPRALPKAGAWKASNAPITRAEAEAAGEATWKSSERRRRQSYDEAGNPVNHGNIVFRDRRLSRSDIKALNFDTRRKAGPSKSILKKKGQKAKQRKYSLLARAAAKRAGCVLPVQPRLLLAPPVAGDATPCQRLPCASTGLVPLP